MKSNLAWSENIVSSIQPPPQNSDIKTTIWGLAFKPDGSQLIMAIGDRIFVYQAQTGNLLHSLRGHAPGKNVYCVDYSKDSKRFSSGGADNYVVIWTSKGDGHLKYEHSSSVQALTYNPINHSLASIAVNDFGIWTTDQGSVQKFAIPAKGLCGSWTPDGLILAIGLKDGTIILRERDGAPRSQIKRKSPIWSLQWNPQKSESENNQLAVCCWDETLSFYDSNTRQLGVDKELDFLPCSISFFSNGEFFVLNGSDQKVTLWTKQGVCLGPIAEQKSWIWSAAVRPRNNSVVLGTDDGTVGLYQIHFSIVHGLYEDRYAYRQLMTDMIIQHLSTEQKVRIKCRDLIKKISVYKDRLAVLLPEKIIIYAVSPDDENDMRYKSYQKINKKFECSLMVLTYYHIVICHQKKMQLCNFNGEIEREWLMDSNIRFLKANGGLPGREGLLVGLKSGSILKLFVDNPFPITLYKHNQPILCLDLSLYRNKLAFVDDNNNLTVMDLKTQSVIQQQSGISAVAFNSELEDMISYSGEDTLWIKTGPFAPTTQKMIGFVVGFKGSRIFALHYITINIIDLPQSAAMYKYLQQKDMKMAYKVACLGVTDSDWRYLGIQALQKHDFELARKCFIKVKDIRFLELINLIQQQRKSPGYNDMIMMGQVTAYQGRYKQAAALFVKGGNIRKAIDMYKELKQLDKAEEYIKMLGQADQKEIIEKEFTDDQDPNWTISANLFLNIGDYKNAVRVIGKRGDMNWLIEICRQLNRSEHAQALQLCAVIFRQHGHHAYAKEAYLKLDDLKSLLTLHIELERWEEAFRICKQNPNLQVMLYLPYAQWLIAHDRFDQAKEAYKKAGMAQEAYRLLLRLTINAIEERKFTLVFSYYWKLCLEHLSQIKDCMNPTPQCANHFADFETFKALSDLYYAYSWIHRYAESPFLLPIMNYEETIFNAARFLLNTLPNITPRGINKLYVYYSLGRLASKLGAYKTAKTAYEKLLGLKIPYEWQEEVEISALTTKAKPYSDKEELYTMCYRCMNPNPPLINDDACLACKHPIIRSFISFMSLPLVEFQPNSGIPPERIAQLINSESPMKETKKKKTQAPGWQDTLNIEGMEQDFEDIFVQKMSEWAELQTAQDQYRPLVVDQSTLAAIPPQDVFIVDLTQYNPTYPKKYYKLMIPDVHVFLCPSCNHFFLQDEFDFAYLENEACPVCKVPIVIIEEIEN